MRGLKKTAAGTGSGSWRRRDVLAGGAMALGIAFAGPSLRAEGPRRGGRLRIGHYVSSANETLDPTQANTTHEYTRMLALMSTLVSYAPDLTPMPELAESWEVSSDNRTWHFVLRKDVTFHDGRAFTAADAVFSLSRHMGEDSKSKLKSLFKEVTAVTADGPYVLRVELASPNADLPVLLGDEHTCIHPDGYTDFTRPIGTGPFKLLEFEPGVSFAATRYDGYFRAGQPYVDELETWGIPDTAARTSALLAGDIDFMVRVDPRNAAVIEDADGFDLVIGKGSRHTNFVMMCDQPPFDNPDLRLALKLVTDREGMLRTIRNGYGSLGNDNPMGPSDAYFCTELPQRTYDPDQARFLLKRAGMENIKLTLHTSEAAGGPEAPDMALHLKNTAAQIGIEIDVQREPADSYWSTVWIKKAFHMSHWQPRPSPDLRFMLTYYSGAPWNESRFVSPELDSILEQARAVTDRDQRYMLYCSAQRIVRDEGGTIVPLFYDFLDARVASLQGVVPYAHAEGGGNRVAETAWYDL